MSTEQALQALLAGSGLTHRHVGERAVALVAPDEAAASSSGTGTADEKVGEGDRSRPDSSEDSSPPGSKTPKATPDKKALQLEEVTVTIPEVLVVGSKILNMDIPRTRDDAQPYVIYDRATIERSGASNIDDFLKKRLPMNVTSTSPDQGGFVSGPRSEINLRGLGADETLILVDGHRTASPVNSGTISQPDLNGIPLAAVERIEVLPTTASGIYGGSATGGVINVVLRTTTKVQRSN